MKKSGFTLIELMVAVAILAVLVMVGFGTYLRAQQRGLDARRQGDIKAFQNAMEQYFSLNEDYPADEAEAQAQFSSGVLPKDPVNADEYVYTFGYTAPGGGSGYCTCAKLILLSGNSADNACDFAGGGTKNYFCVTNLQ